MVSPVSEDEDDDGSSGGMQESTLAWGEGGTLASTRGGGGGGVGGVALAIMAGDRTIGHRARRGGGGKPKGLPPTTKGGAPKALRGDGLDTTGERDTTGFFLGACKGGRSFSCGGGEAKGSAGFCLGLYRGRDGMWRAGPWMDVEGDSRRTTFPTGFWNP